MNPFRPFVKNFRLAAALLLLAAIVAGVPATMGSAGDADDKPIRTVADLNRKTLGVLSGTSLDLFTNSALDFCQVEYYETIEQQVKALYAGEIDAIVDDYPCNIFMVQNDPKLRLVDGILLDDKYAFGLRQDDDAIYDKVNNALKAILADADLMKEIIARWTGDDASARKMPEFVHPEAGRILRYGYSPISPPFCYEETEGVPIGLEVELMNRIAQKLGYRLRVVRMEFHELIPQLLADKVDVVSSCLSVTPEREEIIRFSQSYFDGGVGAVVLKDPADKQPKE